jgi:hypothetical protein
MPEDNDEAISSSNSTLNYLNEDLEEILSLPYKQFWSHIVFEPSLVKFLDMYGGSLRNNNLFIDYIITLLNYKI